MQENQGFQGLNEVREWLGYDPATGNFVWKRPPARKIRAGSIAGSQPGKHGYRRIEFRGVHYLASRLAWFYTHGEWPPETIDHINRDKGDDRLVNLRAVSQAENNLNSLRPQHYKSRVNGGSEMAKRKRLERPRRDVLQGKRPPGRPATGKNEMIAIRWPRELLDGIDRYAQDQCLARPVALRQIVTKFLADQGIIDINSMFPANAA